MTVHANLKGVTRRQTSKESDSEELGQRYHIDEDDVELIEMCINDLSRVKQKDVYVKRVKSVLKDIHSNILSSARGNSVVFILKFVCSAHLKALPEQRDAISKALLSYLIEAQELKEYNFTEAKVEITISKEVLEECSKNLEDSKIIICFDNYIMSYTRLTTIK